VPDFRVIPSIDELRRLPTIRALEAQFGGTATTDALRAAAASVRNSIAAGDQSVADEASAATRIEAAAAVLLHDQFQPSLRPVINGTGVIVHTNLGRAPLAAAAVQAVAAVAGGYSNLEYDVARGARGRRDVHAEALICRLTGAEAAAVVNNNAAATLLILAALAKGREVIVSRGELVEIGGGFRVPDVMAQSGAILREVGTTNKTRAADYAAAIGESTALILRVHPSNFRIEGFTERPDASELVALGRRFNVTVVEDLGSGHLSADLDHALARHEPAVATSVAIGIDLCCFSGDKLLGGPQAGLIVGHRDLVERLRRHPLMRALRVDKMTYAALEATLAEYAAGRASRTIPVQQMLSVEAAEVRRRAETLADRIGAIPGWRARIVPGVSAVGGGSAPGVDLATSLVAIEKEGLAAEALERRLRELMPPIIARIEHDTVLLDPRTILADQDSDLPLLLASVR
jgi:L-seryl-tRNA(Ser) seleniumtransferase